MTGRRKYLILLMVALLAAIGGTLYLKMHTASSGYARQADAPHATGRQLNLNDAPKPVQPLAGTAGLSRQSTYPSPASGVQHATAALVQPLKQLASCDYTAMGAARLAYTTNLSAENTRHATQLAVIEASSTVTSLLGSNSKQQLLNDENSRHQTTLASLSRTLQTTLLSVHCQ